MSKLTVDIDELISCLRYLKEINSKDIEDIIWMKGEEQLPIDEQLLEEYVFTGLSNRDFPSVAGWFPDDIGIKITTMLFHKD